jgi:hypothetical protein
MEHITSIDTQAFISCHSVAGHFREEFKINPNCIELMNLIF